MNEDTKTSQLSTHPKLSFPAPKITRYESVMGADALHAEYGNPTFFITMTTNSKWPEIQES